MEPGDAAGRMSDWFAMHGRDLPWRQSHDPYQILVAEFILQQTRMEVGLPRFVSFMKRFPTIEDLAAARESSVLAEWSGLGYYARAKNLHRTAQAIVKRFSGKVPDDPTVLQELPGIGSYTAGAITSIAYNRPEPSLDGNQLRVFGRFLGVDEDTKEGLAAIDTWARRMLDRGHPRILNQALMDFGSIVCVPETPRCNICPLFSGCATRGPRPTKPVAAPKVPVQNWTATRYVRAGRVWLAAPKGKGLLGEHWLPPLSTTRSRKAPDQEHSFSHRKWRVWWTDAKGAPTGKGKWVRLEDLKRLPHGPLTRRFVEAALTTTGGAPSRPRRVPTARRAAPSTRRA